MQQDRMLAAVVETSLYGYGLIDESFVFHYVSPSLAEQLGRRPEELVGTDALDVVHPDDRRLAALGIIEQLEPGEIFDDLGVPVSMRVVRSDGTVVTLEVGALDQRHHPDIGAFVVRTRPMRGHEHLNTGLHLLAEGAPSREVLGELVLAVEGIIEDGRGIIAARDPRRAWHLPADVDPILTLSHPLPGGEMPELWRRAQAGRECEMSFVEDLEAPLAAAARAAGFEACWAVSVPHLSIEAGIVVWRSKRRSPHVSVRIELVRVADAIGLAIERDRSLRQLEHAASHDRLTGLVNRASFHDALTELVTASAEGDQPVGLLFVDLDGFKSVNDDHGHQVGDAVLREVAQRLRAAVRGSDVVGRLGGDEFAVLCRQVSDPSEIESVAERIVAHLACSISLDDALSDPVGPGGAGGPTVRIGASVGVVLGPPAWAAALLAAGMPAGERLLAEADRAMYEAKRAGGARWSARPVPVPSSVLT